MLCLKSIPLLQIRLSQYTSRRPDAYFSIVDVSAQIPSISLVQLVVLTLNFTYIKVS